MQHNGWDHALKVTAGGKGLVGHAGAILLRKAADQVGLTSGLSAALLKKGTSPLLDRGLVLASLAVAIALGATSMSDIGLLTPPRASARGRAQRPRPSAAPSTWPTRRPCSTASPGHGQRRESTPGT